jgi:glutaredoxin
MPRIKVKGSKKDHEVLVYALSTCGWCKKTKQFLRNNSIEYEYVDLDLASPEERQPIIDELSSNNIPLAFPITIIDNQTMVRGYNPDKLTEELRL